MRIGFHLALAIALGIGAVGTAFAYDPYDYETPVVQPTGNVHYAHGEVLEAQPIYRTVQRPMSERVCWDEPVEFHRGGSSSAGGALVGAIIGGVLGSNVGSGHGRRAATAAGTVIGASIGHQASRRDRYVSHGYEQRCETRRSWEPAQDIVGYDVTYRYRGQIYQTRTDHHPGDSIRVRVAVDAMP